MDEIAKEIALKRAALNQHASSNDRPKKYMKRGERLQAEQATELQASAPAISAAPAPAASDSGQVEKAAEQQDGNKALLYASEEIVKALRGYSVPIMLFGESISDQLARLRTLQLQVS
jgi:hypothetical protein